jgi:peptidoglycan/LPS O-acetylase OafA/YrhL
MPEEVAYMWTICRVDALAMGAGAAVALRAAGAAAWLMARRRALVAFTVALFVVGGVVTHGYPRLGFATQAIGYSILAWCSAVALVLAVLAQAGTEQQLGTASLRSIGKYSYAMYVFHVPIHHVLGVRILPRVAGARPSIGASLVYFVALTASSYVAALVSYQLVEKHFLRLKRFFPVARPVAA